VKRREEMNFWERLYIIEVVKGIVITFSRMVRNLVMFVLGYEKKMIGVPAVIQYPDERRDYPERFRGRHRLTLKQNGDIKCTACFLCATACPAKCIHIEAAEHSDPNVEKFPRRYEIDTLLCIYCGYCVEACPVDAIRMDTGIHPEVYPPDPRAFIEDKETLMQRSRDLEDKGARVLYEMHMKKMQQVEKSPSSEVKFG
jgi:NADH-quinone oxidoreductase subunit I